MRMNILYVNKVSPRLGGGAELRLLEIGSRLAARGHCIHVICGKTETDLPDQENIEGINVHYIKILPDIFFSLKKLSFYLSRYLFYPSVILFGDIISMNSIDVIIDNISPSPSLIYLLARRKGVT